MTTTISNSSDPLSKRPQPVVLLLLDGWGVSKSQEHNAIRQAKIPNFKSLVAEYPAGTLKSLKFKNSDIYKIIGSGRLRPLKKIAVGKILATEGLRQLRISEIDKFALVSNFFDNNEKPFDGEDYLIADAGQVTKELVKAIRSKKYDFIVVSFSDIDKARSINKFPELIKSIEKVDKQLGEIVPVALSEDVCLLISSAYGYSEEAYDFHTDTWRKNNSESPVPFIAISNDLRGKRLGKSEAPVDDLSFFEATESLINLAPTILSKLNLHNKYFSKKII